MEEIIFESALAQSNFGMIDGPCKLPEGMPWPHDSGSAPLFHLLSVPAFWLIRSLTKEFPVKEWISVFVSYDKKSHSQYGKMSSDEPDHTDAVVLMHDMTGRARSAHLDQAVSSKSVRLAPAVEGDDNVASYIGSTPCWVQDPVELPGYDWVLSIYGPDMDVSLAENRGILSDGTGYVFLKSDVGSSSNGVVGKFFLQI
jgi:hypothetical protein